MIKIKLYFYASNIVILLSIMVTWVYKQILYKLIEQLLNSTIVVYFMTTIQDSSTI